MLSGAVQASAVIAARSIAAFFSNRCLHDSHSHSLRPVIQLEERNQNALIIRVHKVLQGAPQAIKVQGLLKLEPHSRDFKGL